MMVGRPFSLWHLDRLAVAAIGEAAMDREVDFVGDSVHRGVAHHHVKRLFVRAAPAVVVVLPDALLIEQLTIGGRLFFGGAIHVIVVAHAPELVVAPSDPVPYLSLLRYFSPTKKTLLTPSATSLSRTVLRSKLIPHSLRRLVGATRIAPGKAAVAAGIASRTAVKLVVVADVTGFGTIVGRAAILSGAGYLRQDSSGSAPM